MFGKYSPKSIDYRQLGRTWHYQMSTTVGYTRCLAHGRSIVRVSEVWNSRVCIISIVRGRVILVRWHTHTMSLYKLNRALSKLVTFAHNATVAKWIDLLITTTDLIGSNPDTHNSMGSHLDKNTATHTLSMSSQLIATDKHRLNEKNIENRKQNRKLKMKTLKCCQEQWIFN